MNTYWYFVYYVYYILYSKISYLKKMLLRKSWENIFKVFIEKIHLKVHPVQIQTLLFNSELYSKTLSWPYFFIARHYKGYFFLNLFYCSVITILKNAYYSPCDLWANSLPTSLIHKTKIILPTSQGCCEKLQN